MVRLAKVGEIHHSQAVCMDAGPAVCNLPAGNFREKVLLSEIGVKIKEFLIFW